MPSSAMTARTTSSLGASSNADPYCSTFLSSIAYDGATARIKESSYSWDVAGCCQRLLPTFHYLSNKLAFQGLHVAIIIVDSSPEIIPAWPIDKHTQQFLKKLVARAEVKYSIDSLWMTAFDRLCITDDIQEAIHLYRESTYLVHRSLLQKDVIYSGNGLTVLAVDYVFKFKEQLMELAREDVLPLFRDDYKESSIALLKHINDIYKDIPLSKAYLRRVYMQFELKEEVLEEVFEAYYGKYRYSTRQKPPALEDITVHLSTHDGTLAFIIDETQESPRKVPALTRRQTTADISNSAASSRLSERARERTLGSPFEYNSTLADARLTRIERPRSPKGDLFESSRSTSTTSPKSLNDISDSEYTHSQDSSFPSSVEDCDLVRIETASTTSSRRRKLFRPWLKLSRYDSLPSFLKHKISARCASFGTWHASDVANSNILPLPLDSISNQSVRDRRQVDFR